MEFHNKNKNGTSMSQDAGRCSSDKVPDCRETVAFSQQPCRRNRTQTIRAMLLDGRQAASDLQGMDGKTDSDQFAAESERVSLADFSGQEHRWNCPKANRIDDTMATETVVCSFHSSPLERA